MGFYTRVPASQRGGGFKEIALCLQNPTCQGSRQNQYLTEAQKKEAQSHGGKASAQRPSCLHSSSEKDVISGFE